MLEFYFYINNKHNINEVCQFIIDNDINNPNHLVDKKYISFDYEQKDDYSKCCIKFNINKLDDYNIEQLIYVLMSFRIYGADVSTLEQYDGVLLSSSYCSIDSTTNKNKLLSLINTMFVFQTITQLQQQTNEIRLGNLEDHAIGVSSELDDIVDGVDALKVGLYNRTEYIQLLPMLIKTLYDEMGLIEVYDDICTRLSTLQ